VYASASPMHVHSLRLVSRCASERPASARYKGRHSTPRHTFAVPEFPFPLAGEEGAGRSAPFLLAWREGQGECLALMVAERAAAPERSRLISLQRFARRAKRNRSECTCDREADRVHERRSEQFFIRDRPLLAVEASLANLPARPSCNAARAASSWRGDARISSSATFNCTGACARRS